MDKKGNEQFFHQLQNVMHAIKRTYLYKMVSKFLSVVCSIILVILLIVGAFMFYFNIKSNAYAKKGLDYTAPFGLYTIISGSMEPNVSVYDVVIAVEGDISKINVGDVITFVSNWDINYGVTVTHRVVAKTRSETGEYQLTTKGDNNGSVDGGIVTQNNLIGKVVGRLPQLGRLQFFLATKMGWFMVVFVPALAIIIFDMIKIFKLYVLKGQLDKVKTTKEVSQDIKEEKENKENLQERNQIKRELKHTTTLPTLSEEENDKPKVLLETILEPIIEEDKNIDTVELPKVGEDGKVKENTLELPSVKILKVEEKNTVSLEDILEESQKEVNEIEKKSLKKDIPLVKNKKQIDEEIIPLLRRNNVQEESSNKRRKLIRRK